MDCRVGGRIGIATSPGSSQKGGYLEMGLNRLGKGDGEGSKQREPKYV